MLTIKKPTRKLLAFITGFFGLLILNGCAPPEARAILKGERLLQEGKHEQAAREFRKAVELLPDNAQAWNHLGLALHHSGASDEAIRAYVTAVNLDPRLPAARFNLGQLYFSREQFAAATDAFSGFVLLEPENYEGWLKLGLSQSRLASAAAATERARQYETARQSLETAVRLRATPEALNALAVAHVGRGQPREAIPALYDALRRQSNYPPSLLNLAVIHHQNLNDPAGAMTLYGRYLALEPRPSNWMEVEATVAKLETQQRAALEQQTARERKELAAAPPTQATPAPGASEQPPPARETTVTPAPKPVQTLTTQADPLTEAPAAPEPEERRSPETQRTASPPATVREEPARSTPEPGREDRQPAPVPVESERAESQVAQPARTETPVQPEQPSTRSPARDDTARGAAPAAPSGEQAASGRRSGPRAWFGRDERVPMVTPLNGRGAEGTPPPPVIDPQAGTPTDTLADTPPSVTPLPGGRPPTGRYTYHAPLRPPDGNRHTAYESFSQGLDAQRKGEHSRAIAAYRAATQADPAFFEAWYNLGLAAYEADQIKTALFACEYALSIQPASLDARYNFALALQKGEFARDAANELERLIRQYPDETRAHLTLANIYARQLYQNDKAREHYQRVLDLEPRHAQATAIRYWLRQ